MWEWAFFVHGEEQSAGGGGAGEVDQGLCVSVKVSRGCELEHLRNLSDAI